MEIPKLTKSLLTPEIEAEREQMIKELKYIKKNSFMMNFAYEDLHDLLTPSIFTMRGFNEAKEKLLEEKIWFLKKLIKKEIKEKCKNDSKLESELISKTYSFSSLEDLKKFRESIKND